MTEEEQKKLRKLQLIELDLLKEVDRICKKHNIKYYLGEGSLLGAIRHNGFIPWDDDIDVLMLREEYKKFLNVAVTEINSKYEIQHSTTINNYWSPFIKVRFLDNSFFKQSHIAHLTNHNGPCLDIFPVDNVPKKDSFGQYMQSILVRCYRKAISYKLKIYPITNWKQFIIRYVFGSLSIKKIHILLDKKFQKYNNPKNEYVVNLASYYNYKKQTVPKSYYGEPRYVKFEDGMFPVPHEAEKVLTSVYGDYMKLPPLEEQTIHHHWDEE